MLFETFLLNTIYIVTFNYFGIVQLIISSIIGILLRILIAHTRIQVNVK